MLMREPRKSEVVNAENGQMGSKQTDEAAIVREYLCQRMDGQSIKERGGDVGLYFTAIVFQFSL